MIMMYMALKGMETLDALIIFRKQIYEDRIAIRFVDYIGERTLISGIGAFLKNLLSETDGARVY